MLPVLVVVVVVMNAAPVQVVAVQGEPAAEVRSKLADPKSKQVDASKVRAYLKPPAGLVGAQLFEQFAARPIDGWPANLNEAWNSGLVHCRTIAGPPPWKQAEGVNALACGERLSEFLWQRYVENLGASMVYEVTLIEVKDEFLVSAIAWDPGKSTLLEVLERGAPAAKTDTIDRAMRALLERRGASRPRQVVSELAAKPLVDPWAKEAPVLDPLTLGRSCQKLPVKLTFSSDGPLQQSLAARWAPADATGPAAPCKLTFSEHDESLDGLGAQTLRVVTSTLECAGVSVASEQALVRLGSKKPLDAVSAKLAQALSARLCR